MPRAIRKFDTVTIDAAGRSLGRVASEVAIKLRGKHLPAFRSNQMPRLVVEVVNLAKAKFTGSKLETRQYHHFSGYPGGLKTTTLRQEFQKNPGRLFRNMVARMLPKNRQSSVLLGNLKITTEEKSE